MATHMPLPSRQTSKRARALCLITDEFKRSPYATALRADRAQ
jgi:hypothetical protein